MANRKISELNEATLPLAGTELVAIVQGAETRRIAVADLAPPVDLSAVLSPFLLMGA
jgi:hypothetical protein